jgi:hypothetical protein
MRRLIFVALLASLLVALLLDGLHPTDPTPRGIPAPATIAGVRRLAPAPPPADARTQVRPFLAAFLSYEVGRSGPAVEARIEDSASPHFARQLLSEPTRPVGRPGQAAARITSLRIDRVPGHPYLVLVSGDARRPEGPEPFSFLFARRGGRWLALAPGE